MLNKMLYKMKFKNTKSNEMLGKKNFFSTLLYLIVGDISKRKDRFNHVCVGVHRKCDSKGQLEFEACIPF